MSGYARSPKPKPPDRVWVVMRYEGDNKMYFETSKAWAKQVAMCAGGEYGLFEYVLVAKPEKKTRRK